MIDKKKLHWTKEDEKAVRKFKKDLESGKIKTVLFDFAFLQSLHIKKLSEDKWI
jgi:hypothetical protein